MSDKQMVIAEPNGKALVELSEPTPMQLVKMAMNQGLDAEKLGALMDLQLRWEANEARKAYVRAKGEFQKNAPAILKTKEVAYQQVKYRHAELDKICETLIPELAKYGLSYSWKPEPTESTKIRMSCILSHRDGHSQVEATLEAPADTTGSKNAVQAIGSTNFYLERYTLLAALGIAPKNSDDDGQTSEGLTEQAVEDYCITMRDAMNGLTLKDAFAEAYRAAQAINDERAKGIFTQVKEQRKRELAK